jgi:predicted ABC-type ATPase
MANRVTLGGHGVPEDKIEPRYDRSLSLLLEAIKLTDRAYLFDNSGAEHVLIAEVTEGRKIELKTHDIPGWFIKSVYEKIRSKS